MKMATDNLKNAAEERLTARKRYIEERLKPIPDNFNVLNEAHLVSLVKELQKQLVDTEETRYDLEMKIRKQDYDVSPSSAIRSSIFSFSSSDQWIDDQSQRYQRKIHQTNIEESLENNTKVKRLIDVREN